MAEITIRRMTSQDVDQVAAIEAATFPTPWSREDFLREVTTNVAARYLVVEADGQVVGYAGAWIVLDESQITNIAVSKSFRGQGCGRAVTAGLLQYLSNLGVSYVTLEVRVSNAPAISLYKSLGFFKVGMRKKYYVDNGEDAILMLCDKLPEADPDFTEAETVYTDENQTEA